MKRLSFATVALVFFVGSVFGVEVLVDPPRAHLLLPGGQQAFTATAYTENGDTIVIDDWQWSVHPSWIGSITNEGVFTAANRPGHGMVMAACFLDSVRYVGRADVFIEQVRYHVIVRPRDVFLMPGDAVQYDAWLVTNFGDSIGGLSYDWDVEPGWLGDITDGGLFTAGSQDGRGSVIATTTYQELTLRGAGFVAISETGWGGIAGIVTNEQGAPLPDACVSIFIPPHRDPIRTVRTEEDGSYLIATLYPGAYWVRAHAPLYLPEFYDNSPGIEGATPVLVEGGVVAQGIDFSLALGGVIAGQVAATEGSIPLRHAHVSAFRIWPHPFQHRAPIDDQGYYAIEGLPPGTYVVRADADGFAPEFWQEAPVPEEADPIVIDIGSIVEGINFTLDPLWPPLDGELSGLVTDDSTGAPLADAHIMLFKLRPGPITVFHQRTTENGSFAFEHLPYGHYVVFCGAPGYLHEYYDDVPFWRQATILAVNENSSPEIAIALAPRTSGGLCAFTGMIQDAGGNPLEGVIIRAEGAATATAETGPDGRYYMELTEGQYVLSADRASLATRYYPDASEPSGATPLTVDAATPEIEANFTLDQTLDSEEQTVTVPQNFGVKSIYPNPFNATTRINFAVPSAGKVKLAVYDVLGREVAVLVNGMQTAGTQNVTFNAANLASGVYFVRLSGSWGATTHKMLLLK
ncbi:MAG: carboxypeptidase regulatory-like domain-containing protein [bacterium]